MRCGDYKESYLRDEEIFQTTWVKFWMGILFVLLIGLPLFANDYILYVANLIGFAIIGAIGLTC